MLFPVSMAVVKKICALHCVQSKLNADLIVLSENCFFTAKARISELLEDKLEPYTTVAKASKGLFETDIVVENASIPTVYCHKQQCYVKFTHKRFLSLAKKRNAEVNLEFDCVLTGLLT